VSTDLSIFHLFTQASVIVQFVMLLLLIISIISWTFILQRGYALHKARKCLIKFEKRFNLGQDLNRLYDYLAARRSKNSGVEQVFRAGFREFLRLYKQEALPNVVMDGAERALRVALAKEEENLEVHLPFLASVGSISVYIGLFGTVWGIMTAFQALGQIQQATLAMVAPGISEALVATALGLFAAIPAVFAYNRYTQHVQHMVRRYDTLAEEFSGILHRRLHTHPWGEEEKLNHSISE
jgi:biopolymer transport protein TolQ